jgi:phosphosulfolactate synthase
LSGRLLDEFTAAERGGKPREDGITVAYDTFEEPNDHLLEEAADYIDFVKVGTSIPLIVEQSKLQERIRRYHEFGIRVMSGGTLVEVALERGVVPQVLPRLKGLGFDMVEVSELAKDIALEEKRAIQDQVSELSMDCVFFVGKGNRSRLSTGTTVSRIREAFELKSHRVVVEVPKDNGNSGQARSQDQVNWEALNEIVGTFGPTNLILETPYESQQTALILELGPGVNLSGVRVSDVLALETKRLGLTAETLGLSRPLQEVEGSPASKFVYHLIRTERPIDQATLILRSGLPRRTVQAALSFLVDNNMVREVPDSADARKHRYTIK